MKKFIALVLALFFAVANAAETYEASEKITQQVLSGKLSQTVYAGDEIYLIRIKYDNIDENKHQSGGLSDLGLTEKWTGSVCEISGKINKNIAAQTVKAYILVQDDEGKYAKTEFTFEVKERQFWFNWNSSYGRMDQTVRVGQSITPIFFDYDAIEEWGVSGLPSGLISDIDENMHYIIVAGSVDIKAEPGDYEYKVTVKDYNSEEHTLSGVITVKGRSDITSIKVVENETQKVTAGNAIKPIVLEFANVEVTENLDNFKMDQTLPASLRFSVEENVVTVSGTVDEKTKDDTYTIKVIAKGKVNNDTAFATVLVTHQPVETTLSVIENKTQTVTAGDSIEPIVFKFENAVDIGELTGFPGSYTIVPDNATKSIFVIGEINEGAKGSYTVKLTVNGADNNASAEASINVTPLEMKFELVEGSDNQTVFAGKAITPIVYQYEHLLSVKGSGFPADLEVVQDQENNLIKISGTVNSALAAKEYVYSFAVTDFHGDVSTVTGKINVVRESSSSSVASSSSVMESSSSLSSSSSIVASSSSLSSSSWSSATGSSSSVAKSSSSSAKSSSSVKQLSSSSEPKSSTSLSSSSSIVASSSSLSSSSWSSTTESSSSNNVTSSSGNANSKSSSSKGDNNKDNENDITKPSFRVKMTAPFEFEIVMDESLPSLAKRYAVMDMKGQVLTIGELSDKNARVKVPITGAYIVKVGLSYKRVNVR